MNSGNNNIPSFEYKPEFRQEMEEILVKRKSKKRFLAFFFWTLSGLALATGLFYFLHKEQVLTNTDTAASKLQEHSNKEDTSINKAVTIEHTFAPKSIHVNSVVMQNFTTESTNSKTEKSAAEINKMEAAVKRNKTESSRSAIKAAMEEKEMQQEMQVQASTFSKVPANDSSLSTDSVVGIVENAAVFEDSLVRTVQNTKDTNLADTLAKTPNDSVKKTGAQQLVLHFGAGLNNSIGEGEYSNGIAPSYKLGLHFIKEIGKGHAVGIGLMGKYYSALYNYGGYDTVKVNIANSNNLGYDKIEARVVTHNKNNYAIGLSLPLYYQFSAAKFNVSIGASIDYLLLNSYTQSADTSKYGINTFIFYTEVFVEKTNAAKIVKHDFAAINQFNVGPFAELAYQFSPKISMGLMGQMLVQDITNNSLVNITKNSTIYSLNISLKYHF
jgi:hypothetical protein